MGNDTGGVGYQKGFKFLVGVGGGWGGSSFVSLGDTRRLMLGFLRVIVTVTVTVTVTVAGML